MAPPRTLADSMLRTHELARDIIFIDAKLLLFDLIRDSADQRDLALFYSLSESLEKDITLNELVAGQNRGDVFEKSS